MFLTSVQVALSLAIYLQGALSLINLPVCDEGCMAQNSNGTWCYHPTFNPVPTSTICQGGLTGNDPRFTLALQSHVRGHLSIAYYQTDGTFLGGSDYVVTSSIIICATGLNGQGSLNTQCSSVSQDNELGGDDWCMADGGPSPVTDGCYDATVNSETTTAVATGTETSNGSPSDSPSTTGSSTPSQGNSGLSLSDKIALGVGLGIGLPTLFVGI